MDKKIYHVSRLAWSIPIGYSFLVAIILFSSIMFASQILNVGNLSTMLLLLLCIIILLIFLFYIAIMSFSIPTISLEISDEGVTFCGVGYRLYTSWENVASLGWTRFSSAFPGFIQLKEPAVVTLLSLEEGKLSRQAVTEKRSWWIPNRQLKAEAQYTQYIRIPVVLFRRKDKQGGSINQYLQQYLPHLMETKQ